MGLGRFSRLLNLGLRSFWTTKSDIFGNGSGEKIDILFDDGDLATQRCQIPLAYIVIADNDFTLGNIIGSIQKLDNAAFVRPCLADNGHGLTGRNLETDILQRGAAIIVLKCNVIKFEASIHRTTIATYILVKFGFGVNQL